MFAAISDITRMGEWSPECVAGRWVAPATGPAVGAVFEGDNVAAIGPVTLKKWTTSSTVTACEPGAVFEFVAEGYTTWRYELSENDGDDHGQRVVQFPAVRGMATVRLLDPHASRPLHGEGDGEDPGPHQGIAGGLTRVA